MAVTMQTGTPPKPNVFNKYYQSYQFLSIIVDPQNTHQNQYFNFVDWQDQACEVNWNFQRGCTIEAIEIWSLAPGTAPDPLLYQEYLKSCKSGEERSEMVTEKLNMEPRGLLDLYGTPIYMLSSQSTLKTLARQLFQKEGHVIGFPDCPDTSVTLKELS